MIAFTVSTVKLVQGELCKIWNIIGLQNGTCQTTHCLDADMVSLNRVISDTAMSRSSCINLLTGIME